MKANRYEEDASNSSGNEGMFDELAADIPYNRFDIIKQNCTDQSNNDAGNWLKKTAEFDTELMLHYNENANENEMRGLEAADGDYGDEEEELGSVEGGGDLEEYDRHNAHNLLSENEED